MTTNYSTRTRQRNVDYRAILDYVRKNPNVTASAVVQAFPHLSVAKVEKAMTVLQRMNFLYVSRKEKSHGVSYRHYYSVADYSEEYLDQELPLERPKDYIRSYKVKPKSYVVSNVARDPLDTYLMGSGEAPSLAFHRSQYVSTASK